MKWITYCNLVTDSEDGMILVNIHDAKTRLSELVALVEKMHEVVRICRNGVPVGELTPLSGVADPLKQNPAIKDIKILCDPTAPLDSDEWPEELHASV